MKKIAALICILSLTLSLCACARQAAPATEPPAEDPAPAQTAGPAPGSSMEPTEGPSETPAAEPTTGPTEAATAVPTVKPTKVPATAVPTVKPTKVPATARPTAAPTQAPATPAPTPEPTPKADLRSVAKQYIGSPVSALYAAIGRPGGSSYADSCLSEEPGAQDGELYYDGFTVYTVKESSGERVYDVE